jgi:hypothetical protein
MCVDVCGHASICLSAHVQVHVTDNGWTTSGFRGGEGDLSFELSYNMPAGEVWVYEAENSASYTNAYGTWTPVCCALCSIS